MICIQNWTFLYLNQHIQSSILTIEQHQACEITSKAVERNGQHNCPTNLCYNYGNELDKLLNKKCVISIRYRPVIMFPVGIWWVFIYKFIGWFKAQNIRSLYIRRYMRWELISCPAAAIGFCGAAATTAHHGTVHYVATIHTKRWWCCKRAALKGWQVWPWQNRQVHMDISLGSDVYLITGLE